MFPSGLDGRVVSELDDEHAHGQGGCRGARLEGRVVTRANLTSSPDALLGPTVILKPLIPQGDHEYCG